MAQHFMRNRSILQRNVNHCPLRFAHALADGIGGFIGFANGDADSALAISDDGQRAEGQALAALVDLGDAIDADQLLDIR